MVICLLVLGGMKEADHALGVKAFRLPRQRPLTPLETVLREFFLTGLDTVDTWEGYPECFELLGQPDVVMELKALPAATP